MTNRYKEVMGRKILRHAMRKKDLGGMLCYDCIRLNHCYDVCEALDRTQYVISCSRYRKEDERTV